MTRRRISWGLAVVLVAAAAVVGARWWGSRYEFDAARWKAAQAVEACESDARKKMVGDLRRNHLRDGMTADELRALLGAPDHMTLDRRSGRWWVWVTGPDWADCSTFVVRVVKGRVVESGVGQT
jgi:hypothetical protein